jgi:hypothetical protein
MIELRELLKEFGAVEQCELINNEVHIKITKGFSINAINTFGCMRVIVNHTYDNYPVIKTIKTDNDLFHLILTKGAQ